MLQRERILLQQCQCFTSSTINCSIVLLLLYFTILAVLYYMKLHDFGINPAWCVKCVQALLLRISKKKSCSWESNCEIKSGTRRFWDNRLLQKKCHSWNLHMDPLYFLSVLWSGSALQPILWMTAVAVLCSQRTIWFKVDDCRLHRWWSAVWSAWSTLLLGLLGHVAEMPHSFEIIPEDKMTTHSLKDILSNNKPKEGAVNILIVLCLL